MAKTKYIVIDTNIPLTDSNSIIELGREENTVVVIPTTVLEELDNKKSGFEEVNWQARATARLLANAKVVNIDKHAYGTRTELDVDGNKILIIGLSKYVANPAEYGGNDQRIIETAIALQNAVGEDDEVVLMSIDYYMRLRAQSIGLQVMDYKIIEDADFQFVKEMVVEDIEQFKGLHDSPILSIDPDHKIENYSYKFTTPSTEQMKLATVSNGLIKVLGKETEGELRQQDCAPINAEQLLVSKAIQDPKIDLVMIEGRAGSGKNVVAVSNAIRLFSQNKTKYNSIIYIRNSINDEEKGEDIGYLSQPLYSKILTPGGWTTMGEINIGDVVSTPNGIPAKVKTLSPITKKMTYKIETKEGGVTYASGEHLWNIEYGKKERLMTTLEIKKELEGENTYKKKNMFLPSISVQEFNIGKKLLLDPYLVGYLIGAGIIGGSHVRVAIGDNDAKESLYNLRNSIAKNFSEYTIERTSNKNYAYTISKNKKGTAKGNKIRECLEHYNLLGKADTKRIPIEYLQSSIENRIELLRGLIDSDGTIRKARGYSSEVTYTSINYDLLVDIRELVKSLGGRGKISQKTDGGPTKVLGVLRNSKPSYIISISGLNFIPAKLKRKAANYVQSRSQREKIVRITEHKEELVRCIGLDDTAHLYITDDYIPTHNSGNDEKYGMYLGPMEDTIDFITRNRMKRKSNEKRDEYELRVQDKIEELKKEFGMESIITTGLRGRTFHNAIIILDEWQNASQATCQKVLTRIGKDCKVIVIGSQRQIDNKWVTKYNNGLAVLLSEARDRSIDTPLSMFAIELKKVVRSIMAEFGESLFSKKGRK